MIQVASSNTERQEVLELFLNIFDDIDPNAVPMTAHDYLYNPLVLQVRDDTTQQVIGGVCCTSR